MKTLIFNVEAATQNDKALREAKRLFGRAGANVVDSSISPQVQKRAGVSFRNVSFTFADGQTVTMAVKMTGDVFEVKINGKVQPLRHQDDHAKAIGEIAALLDKKRAAFQRTLARIKVPLPPSVRTSKTAMLVAKREKRDALKEAVSMAKQELAELTGETAAA